MTHKEFTLWLKGFLAGKNSIDSDELVLLHKELDNVVDEPRVTRYPISDPNTFPKWQEPHINPPFNPTCDTGKRLLNDSKYQGEM